MPLARTLPLAIAATVLVAVPAGASASQVTKQADTDDGSCAPADCSLRDAIKYGPSGDLINVPTGTYHLDMTLGELTVNHPLTITGAGAGPTTVTADGHHRVFFIGSSGAVMLRKLEVTGGNGEAGEGGGGIVGFGSGVLTLDHVRVTGNSADVTHSADTTMQYIGGGGIGVVGPLTVTDSTIDHNEIGLSAAAGMTTSGGAGVYVIGGPLKLTRTEVRDNDAVLGAQHGFSPRTVTENGGGGIFSFNATVSLTASTLAGNSFRLTKATSPSASPSTYSGGGGIYADGGTLTATNSTVSGNGAAVDALVFDNGGGGLYAKGAPTMLTNATIAGNTASNNANNAGGGIYAYGATVKPRRTIFARNTADANANCFGTVSSQGHNLDSGNTCGLAGPADTVNTNPLLAALANNGGPTRTLALMRGSPAINAAGLSGCPASDQRGHSRPRGPACDIGAFEADVPNARTAKAKSVKARSARLRGTLTPNGRATTYLFEFGRTKAYGSKTAVKSAGAGSFPVAVSTRLSRLKPHKTYHYRLVAINAAGTTFGADRKFKTKRAKKKH